MSVVFDNVQTAVFQNKEHLKDAQLRLNGVLCRVSGFVIGRMEGTHLVHIIVFSKDTSPASIERIHDFVHHCLQEAMDAKMKSLA
jgi:hypothetical protein